MRFTYYCKPGRMLRTREHYVYLGGWINPPGYIILQHGNFSYAEYSDIMNRGYINVYSTREYSYLDEWTDRKDLREYRELTKQKVGILRQNRDNLYIGMVRLFDGGAK